MTQKSTREHPVPVAELKVETSGQNDIILYVERAEFLDRTSFARHKRSLHPALARDGCRHPVVTLGLMQRPQDRSSLRAIFAIARSPSLLSEHYCQS